MVKKIASNVNSRIHEYMLHKYDTSIKMVNGCKLNKILSNRLTE